MSALFTRAEVAKELGICSTTLYRWEKVSKISPVTPKKLKRSGQLRYTQEDIQILRAWMNELEDAAEETAKPQSEMITAVAA